MRLASPDERDTINPGLPPGISGGGSAETRNVGNGNAFSADVLWHVMREWNIPRSDKVSYSLMTADDVYAADPQALELFFANIDTSAHKGDRAEAILQHMLNFAKKYATVRTDGVTIMPKLDLILNTNQTVPFQVSHPCDVPAHLAASAEYAIALMVKAMTHAKVSYDPNFWICMLFFQPKGRKVTAEFDGVLFKKGDELEALRPLVDHRPVNSATSANLPAQWGEWSPDRMLAHESVPPDTTHFKKHDSSNAYHAVSLTERSKHYSVCKARLIRKMVFLLQCQCGSQGSAPMGTFYPAWSNYGNCFFIGTAWLQWWLEHVDDVLVHAASQERCQLRFEIMFAIKQAIGLPATEKYDAINAACTSKEEHVGFLWTPQGHCIGDKSLHFLMELLSQTPGGGVQAMRLRDSINQCISAFEWTVEERHYILLIMGPINDCITE